MACARRALKTEKKKTGNIKAKDVNQNSLVTGKRKRSYGVGVRKESVKDISKKNSNNIKEEEEVNRSSLPPEDTDVTARGKRRQVTGICRRSVQAKRKRKSSTSKAAEARGGESKLSS